MAENLKYHTMKFKHLIILPLMGLLAMASVVRADIQYVSRAYSSLTGGTNNLAATATNTLATVDTTSIDNKIVRLAFTGRSLNTNGPTYTLYRSDSVDNTNFTPVSAVGTFTAPLSNATTTVHFSITNPATIGYTKFYLGNPGSVALTNLTGKIVTASAR